MLAKSLEHHQFHSLHIDLEEVNFLDPFFPHILITSDNPTRNRLGVLRQISHRESGRKATSLWIEIDLNLPKVIREADLIEPDVLMSVSDHSFQILVDLGNDLKSMNLTILRPSLNFSRPVSLVGSDIKNTFRADGRYAIHHSFLSVTRELKIHIVHPGSEIGNTIVEILRNRRPTALAKKFSNFSERLLNRAINNITLAHTNVVALPERNKECASSFRPSSAAKALTTRKLPVTCH